MFSSWFLEIFVSEGKGEIDNEVNGIMPGHHVDILEDEIILDSSIEGRVSSHQSITLVSLASWLLAL